MKTCAALLTPVATYRVLLALALALSPEAQTAGTLDGGYDPNVDSEVDATAIQPDGKVIVGGPFHTVGGVTHAGIARLNADGSLDASFTTTLSGWVKCVAVQADGKTLAGGSFPLIKGNPAVQYSAFIARLNPDSSLDGAFTGNTDAAVDCLTVQAGGKILLGGAFTQVNGLTRKYIARLNADGSLDSSFDPGNNAISEVESLALQPDGKILLCGGGAVINGTNQYQLARLNADGSLDTDFNPGAGANGIVKNIVLQPDGRILIGGSFTMVDGTTRNHLARLNPDGSLEMTPFFDPGTGTDFNLDSTALQADGKILVAGHFRPTGSTFDYGTARLDPDGSQEPSTVFSPVGVGVLNLAIQANGKILLGGYFTVMLNGVTRNHIARLDNDAATQSLTVPDATQVQWLRGGVGPEVSQVTFEISIDHGSTWTLLGSGTRIDGGRQLSAPNLSPVGSIRARGRTTSGLHNGSSGLIEAIVNFPSTPLQQWKFAHLDDNVAPDLGDPDGDGLPTLLEYGLALFPETPNTAPAVTLHDYAEGRRLRMFVSRDPAHNDVTVEVQAAGDLAGPWTTVAASVLGAPFAGPGYVGGDGTPPEVKTVEVKTVEVRDTVNVGDAARRFMRVKVTH